MIFIFVTVFANSYTLIISDFRQLTKVAGAFATNSKTTLSTVVLPLIIFEINFREQFVAKKAFFNLWINPHGS